MKNFLRIAPGVNTAPLLAAIQCAHDLWDQNTLRTKHPGTPHKSVSDIWLWFNDLRGDSAEIIDDTQTHPYAGWWALPQAREIIFDLMRVVQATQIGRVIISKLPPGGTIGKHADQGAAATFYQRFQVCLQCGPGCNFIIEDEQVAFKPGEVWLVNNKVEHSVVNNSSIDRIAMVVDLRIPTL